MAINIIHYSYQGNTGWGVIRDQRITPIPGHYPGTADLVRAVTPASLAALAHSALASDSIAAADVSLLSPITRDRQFICQGANYRQHMIESGMNPDDKHFNMIFTKATSCIVAADSVLEKPARVRFLDYEIELGLVMKRDITTSVMVTEANLHEFVAGIVIVNDYSARDVQIPEMQFYKGKSFRTFGPIGPYLCLLEAQDMPLLQDLDLHLTVNGETRQHDSTRNLVNGMADTITELSGVQDLFAGDLIATGTPSGCALSIPSPAKQRIGALLPEKIKWKMFMQVQAKRTQYLQVGDVVEAAISSPDGRINLGRQRNVVVAGRD